MLKYGMHPFPAGIEALLLKLHQLNPAALDHDVCLAAFDWEEGKNVKEGQQLLEKLLVENGNKI